MPIFVNNTEITEDAVHREMQHHPAPSMEEARGEASRALIIRRLLLEAAVSNEIITEERLFSIDEEHEELIIEALLEQVIDVPSADEETCLRYYDQHLDRFVDKTTDQTLAFSIVKNHIKSYLEDKGHMAAFNAYVDTLMDKAQIVDAKKLTKSLI